MRSIPNKLSARFNEPEIRRQIMREYGDSTTAFCGTNEDNELVEMSVFLDKIIVKTYQQNGWLRVNHFDECGYPSGETYEGRWDDESEKHLRQELLEENLEIYTVAIINKESPEAPAWISSFTTEEQAEAFKAKALRWIQDRGLDFLKVDSDSQKVNSEEYLDWLEETYG